MDLNYYLIKYRRKERGWFKTNNVSNRIIAAQDEAAAIQNLVDYEDLRCTTVIRIIEITQTSKRVFDCQTEAEEAANHQTTKESNWDILLKIATRNNERYNAGL